MHHPSDVLASFLNGIACVIVMARSVLARTVQWGGGAMAGGPRRVTGSSPASRPAS
jgi:undecaprenyl-diphosphatase